MQRTSEYRVVAPVVGHDPAGALAWLARQDRWDRRLRTLEGARDEPAEPTRTAPPRAAAVGARRG